jgi:hypothetical protein
MKPVKDQKYKISYKGPFFYNDYFGEAVCNGKIEQNVSPDGSTETWYGFDLPKEDETIWFAEQDIVGMVIE